MSDGAISDCTRPCHLGDWPALALSQPNWVGTAARRYRDQAGQFYILSAADDVFAFEPPAQPDPLGREPLKWHDSRPSSAGSAFDQRKLYIRSASAKACEQARSPCASRV